MKFGLTLYLLFIFLISPFSNADDDVINITIVTTSNITDLINADVINKNNQLSCGSKHFGTQIRPSFRGFGDFYIFCNALYYSKLKVKINFIVEASYHRLPRLVESGQADIAIESTWLEDINTDKVYVSLPIIKQGEFTKGVFTTPDHPLQKVNIHKQMFIEYSAVTMVNWLSDQKTLKTLTNQIITASTQVSIFKMLKAKRGDFALFELSPDKPTFDEGNDITLIPIPNIKVIIDGSRHFIVAKKSPHANKLINAINKGLTIMLAKDEIKHIYYKTGFINPETDAWPIFNPN